MSKATILIIEDEEDILELVEYTLSKEGYSTIGMLRSTNLHQVLQEESIDLIIIDRNLPEVEGAELIHSLRKDGLRIPVIFLSAKDTEQDIIEGFEKGADQYITKPFSPKVLAARVNALISRNAPSPLMRQKDIHYNKESKKFTIDNTPIELTKLEHDLLLEFMKNSNKVLSREYLLSEIWEDGYDKQLKTVNVAVKRLKEKIDPTNTKEYIKTVRGQGYMFC
jgi:DNA-binding response OmpR family regulator